MKVFKNGLIIEYANTPLQHDGVVTDAQEVVFNQYNWSKAQFIQYLNDGVIPESLIDAKASIDLAQAKQTKLNELNTSYNNALTFTYIFNDATELTLTLTETVQTQLNKRGVSLSVNTDPAKTFVFYDNNYQKITRNESDSKGYLEAVADYLEDLREQKTDKTIAINIASTQTELDNIDTTFN